MKIPHPPRIPFLGNTHQVISKNPVQRFIDLGEQYGPIYELDVMGFKLAVVSKYDMAKDLFDEERYDKFIDLPIRHLRDFAGDGLFTAWTYEANWKKAHNILVPGFGRRAMKGYYNLMLEAADRMLAKWYNTPEDYYIEVPDEMTRLTFETIGICGFDYRFNCFHSEKPHPFIDAMVLSLEYALRRTKTPKFIYALMFGYKRKVKKALDYANGLVDEIIKKRKANPEEYRNKIDFLSLMLNARDKESGEKLSDINIRYQIFTFLVAGHETTSNLLSFTIHYLVTRPEILERAYEEVDRILGPDTSKHPVYEKVVQLKYVQQILNETLRLWPPVPFIEFYPKEDINYAGKYEMKEGAAIALMLPTFHRDKTVWGEDAEEFNPDRFAPEEVAKRPHDAFKPFGNGQRACIGRQFAILEATLAIGLILQRYKLHPPKDYVFNPAGATTIKPQGLKVRLEARKDSDRQVAYQPEHQEEQEQQKKVNTLKHDSPLLVLYGSNMGSSEELAMRIANDGRLRGFKVSVKALDEAVGQLPTKGAIVVITSTYNGTPPDNATKFSDWMSSASPSLQGARFAVFGCGNMQWTDTYQDFPHLVDSNLERLGARRIYKRGEADASDDFDAMFEDWYLGFWPALFQEFDVVDLGGDYQSEAIYELVRKGKAGVDYSWQQPNNWGQQAMSVIENRELQNVEFSGRSTRHIEIQLPSAVYYKTGDYLAVVSENSKELIERVAKRFELDLNELIQLKSKTALKSQLPLNTDISISDLLSHHVELQDRATRHQIHSLAQLTKCPPERKRLEQLLESEYYQKEIVDKNLSVLDILEEMPACEISFANFLQLIPPRRLRYYSISSSPKQQAANCSLTVGVLDEEAKSGKGDYKGTCSNYLANKKKGDRIWAVIKSPSSDFRLPENPERPIIMFGPGTGLAPFRGFLQEREALKKEGKTLGKALLFFGCRHPTQDYIYSRELDSYQGGEIAEIVVAFSRLMPMQKVYVQDRMLENGKATWELLQQDAIIYICGDAANMAKDVRKAFLQLHQEQTNGSAVDAEKWMAELLRSGRYRTDVWA